MLPVAFMLLHLIGALFLAGAVAWLFINPQRKIFE